MMRTVADLPSVTLPEDYQTAPGPFLASMYELHGPIFRATTLGGNDVVYLVGPDANRFVLSTHQEHFSPHDGWNRTEGAADALGNGLLFMDGEAHTDHRRMLSPAFTATHMDQYLPKVHQIVQRVVAGWAAAGEIDIYQEAHRITFEIVATVLLGLPAGVDIDRLRILFLRLSAGDVVSTGSEALRSGLADLLAPALHERHHRGCDDALATLTSARCHSGHALRDDQLLAHASNLLFAGHATTASLCTWVFYLLGEHPAYAERVIDEQRSVLDPGAPATFDDTTRMEALSNVLLETERLHPPIANLPRGVASEFEFQGYRVPAGTLVFCSIAGSHMISSVFREPAVFDPDRFAPPRREHTRTPYSLIGFSGGPRTCLGRTFATMEIKVIVSHALRRYRLALSPAQQIVPIYAPISTPLNGIRMNVTPAGVRS
jgi:cytochrome P450